MYFKNFPSFLYDFDINGKTEYRLVKDITQNVRLRKQLLSNVTLYDEYDIRDGETPEIIAEKIYGSPMYHWVVMLVNERYNYIDDFPLPTYQLEKHITAKYGAGNEYKTHHYVDIGGNIAESSISSINVTNPGTGYTISPVVTITRDPIDDDSLGEFQPAVAMAYVSSGQISKIEVINGGKGYIHIPTITIDPPPTQTPAGITATASANIYMVSGVSNYEYETELNESKRRIKLISPTLLNTILKNFKELI